MTDQEHSRLIHEACAALSQHVAEATQADLNIHIELVDMSVLGKPQSFIVRPTVTRVVRP